MRGVKVTFSTIARRCGAIINAENIMLPIYWKFSHLLFVVYYNARNISYSATGVVDIGCSLIWVWQNKVILLLQLPTYLGGTLLVDEEKEKISFKAFFAVETRLLRWENLCSLDQNNNFAFSASFIIRALLVAFSGTTFFLQTYSWRDQCLKEKKIWTSSQIAHNSQEK